MSYRLSEEDYKLLLVLQAGKHPAAAKKSGKIPHTRCTADGYTFDSKLELARYNGLKLLLKAGRIRDLRVHTKFGLVVNGEKVGTYTDDFDYWWVPSLGPAIFVVEDVKSAFTRKDRHYRRARKLMKACHNIDIQEV